MSSTYRSQVHAQTLSNFPGLERRSSMTRDTVSRIYSSRLPAPSIIPHKDKEEQVREISELKKALNRTRQELQRTREQNRSSSDEETCGRELNGGGLSSSLSGSMTGLGSRSGSINGLSSKPSLNRELVSKLRSMTETIKMLSTENIALREENDSLVAVTQQQDKQQGKGDDQQSMESLNAMKKSYEEKIEMLQKKIGELQSSLESGKPMEKSTEKDKYKNLARRLKEERNNYKDMVEEKRKEQEELKVEIEKMTDIIGDLRENCRKLQDELMLMQQEPRSMEDKEAQTTPLTRRSSMSDISRRQTLTPKRSRSTMSSQSMVGRGQNTNHQAPSSGPSSLRSTSSSSHQQHTARPQSAGQQLPSIVSRQQQQLLKMAELAKAKQRVSVSAPSSPKKGARVVKPVSRQSSPSKAVFSGATTGGGSAKNSPATPRKYFHSKIPGPSPSKIPTPSRSGLPRIIKGPSDRMDIVVRRSSVEERMSLSHSDEDSANSLNMEEEDDILQIQQGPTLVRSLSYTKRGPPSDVVPSHGDRFEAEDEDGLDREADRVAVAASRRMEDEDRRVELRITEDDDVENYNNQSDDEDDFPAPPPPEHLAKLSMEAQLKIVSETVERACDRMRSNQQPPDTPKTTRKVDNFRQKIAARRIQRTWKHFYQELEEKKAEEDNNNYHSLPCMTSKQESEENRALANIQASIVGHDRRLGGLAALRASSNIHEARARGGVYTARPWISTGDSDTEDDDDLPPIQGIVRAHSFRLGTILEGDVFSPGKVSSIRAKFNRRSPDGAADIIKE